MVGETVLPNREFRGQAVRETTLDKANRSFECDRLWRKDEVNVVGHNHKGVEFVMARAAVVLEGFEKEFAVGGDLEETTTIAGRGGDEECARACCSGRDRHTAIVRRTSGAKAPWLSGAFAARLKPCP